MGFEGAARIGAIFPSDSSAPSSLLQGSWAFAECWCHAWGPRLLVRSRAPAVQEWPEEWIQGPQQKIHTAHQRCLRQGTEHHGFVECLHFGHHVRRGFNVQEVTVDAVCRKNVEKSMTAPHHEDLESS